MMNGSYKKKHIGLLVVLLLAVLMAFASCALDNTVRTHGNDKCGTIRGAFRGRSFNYYERGLSLSECEENEEIDSKLECKPKDIKAKYPKIEARLRAAVENFNHALQLREDDTWMARTYGMHFIGYFPNRELGIAYYKLGECEKAKDSLEKSLNKAESDKTVYFLNEVRKNLLPEKCKEDGISSPEINLKIGKVEQEDTSVFVKAEETFTSKSRVRISGTITDKNYYVTGVNINGEFYSCYNDNDKPVAIGLSTKTCNIITDVDFCEKDDDCDDGKKTIKVDVVNICGKPNQKLLEVTLDRQGPVFTMDTVEDETPPNKRLKGSVYAASGIRTVMINDRPCNINYLDKWVFDCELKDKYKLVAEDNVGNKTSIESDNSAGIAFLSDNNLIAQNAVEDSDPVVLSWLSSELTTNGTNIIFTLPQPDNCSADNHITICMEPEDFPKEDEYGHKRTVKTYNDAIALVGKVTNNIKNKHSTSLSINKETIVNNFRSKTNQIQFSVVRDLKKNNSSKDFKIVARNSSSGNPASYEIDVKVERNELKVEQEAERLVIGICNIYLDATDKKTIIDEKIHNYFEHLEFNKKTRFKRVINITGQEGKCENICGPTSGIDLLITNKISIKGPQEIAFIEIASIPNDCSADIYKVNIKDYVYDAFSYKGPTETQISQVAKKLQLKYSEIFPLVSGKILRGGLIEHNKIDVKPDGVLRKLLYGTKFIIYRKEPNRTLDAKILGWGRIANILKDSNSEIKQFTIQVEHLNESGLKLNTDTDKVIAK